MGKVLRPLFSAEARRVWAEIASMRACLKLGEFFVGESAKRHDELISRFKKLAGKQDGVFNAQ